jgi:hypothetical protein
MKNIIFIILLVAMNSTLFGQKLYTPDGVVEATDPTSVNKDMVLKTNDNTANQGLTFQNSGGAFSWRIFREQNINNNQQYSLKFTGGWAKTTIDELVNSMTLSYNGDLLLHNGDIRLENAASKLFLGQNNSSGPHGIVFDDETGSQLQLMYRSTPNQLIIEKTDESPIFTIDADNSEAYFSGNVGIGTTSPTSGRLVVSQTALDDHFSGIRLKNSSNGQSSFFWMDQNNNMRFDNSSSASRDIVFNGEGNGNIGIGTTNTFGYKLAVKGNVVAEEVNVKLYANWPDHVFTPTYNLPTLEEVKQHIDEKGHLPNIPSAAEVAENGINLGEMNARLLEKIEELTLYIIKQEKRLDDQEIEFRNRIEKLENKENEKN